MKENAYILALDSSSKHLSFALGGFTGQIWTVETDRDFRQAETVVEQIDKLFGMAKLKLNDVGVLAAGAGPGSFTGLRVGLSAVKAIMLAKRIDCFIVSSLDVIARNVLESTASNHPFVRVLVDARRSRYYTALYRLEHGDLVKIGADEIMTVDAVEATLQEGTVLLGDGAETFQADGLKGKQQLDVQILPESYWYPRAHVIVELVRKNSLLLKPSAIRDVSPAYLGLTEPEERLKEKELKDHG